MKTYEWLKLLRGAKLSHAQFRVAVLAATYAEGSTGERIRPGATRLARDAGMKSVSYVRDCLAALENKGWLECVERGGRGGAGNRATLYRLSGGTYPTSGHVPNEQVPEEWAPAQSVGTQKDESTYPMSGTPSDHSYQPSFIQEGEEEQSSNFNNSETPPNVDPETGEITEPSSPASSKSYEEIWDEPHPLSSEEHFKLFRNPEAQWEDAA